MGRLGSGNREFRWRRRRAAIAEVRPLTASRTFGAGIDPGLDDESELFLGSGCGPPPGAGPPSPSHEVVLGDVVVQQRQTPAAIARRIFELATDLAYGFP